jgi:hypothetical protein
MNRNLNRTLAILMIAFFTLAFSACGGGGGGNGGGGNNPPAQFAFSITVLDDGVNGQAYEDTLTASNATGDVDCAVTTGSLPTGLVLNEETCEISGTPTATGSFTFSITATDSAVPPHTATRSFTVEIADPLVITTTTVPDGTEETAYNQALVATGGLGTKSWTITAGTLPTGITLSSAGVISGTTAEPAIAAITVRVADQASPQQADTQALTLTIDPGVLTIETTTLPDANEDIAYSQFVVADGGIEPYTFSVSDGSLGELSLNAATGQITGTATVSGTLTFDITVTDDDLATDVQSFTIDVIDAPPPTITTTELSDGSRNVSYTQLVEAEDGAGTLEWSMTGTPNTNGLTIDENTGVIEGPPTNTGTFTLHVTVEDDAAQTDTADFTVTFGPGRNDTAATATEIDSDGSDIITGTLSPYAEDEGTPAFADNDFYKLHANTNGIVTIEVFAERSPVNNDILDSVIQIVNASGTQLALCELTTGGSNFTTACLNDDKSGGGGTLDSFLRFRANAGNNTFYLRILDWGGRARPDMEYQINITGANLVP